MTTLDRSSTPAPARFGRRLLGGGARTPAGRGESPVADGRARGVAPPEHPRTGPVGALLGGPRLQRPDDHSQEIVDVKRRRDDAEVPQGEVVPELAHLPLGPGA